MAVREAHKGATKVTLALPGALLAVVDQYVSEHPRAARSGVCAEALQEWLCARQEAEIEQYYANLSAEERTEDVGWVSAAAASAGRFWPLGKRGHFVPDMTLAQEYQENCHMVALMSSRTVSVSIARAPKTVYDFVVAPENLPEWAPAFARSVRKSGNDWIVETSDGPMRIEFVARNPFGVADHRVTVRPGLEILNPMRVLANGDGAEVVFTLFQTPDTSAAKFAADSALVERDLQTLKRVLETGAA